MSDTNLPRRRESQSLRHTLFLGAGLGILFPALILAYFQFSSRFDSEVNLRVRVPMQQYADVLSRGLAVSMWNVDRNGANELMEAVMRNQDVVSLTATDELGKIFVQTQNPALYEATPLREERDILYNGARAGKVVVEVSPARIQQELWTELIKLGLALASQVSISFFLIWLLFERRMLRPLLELKQGAMRLARGDLKQPLLSQRDDEIGSLAVDLDKMRNDLATLIAEREQKNTALQSELTERRRTEDALMFSQAKFSSIFDGSPVAMTVSRMADSCRILDVNIAWVRMFGRQREAALGTSGDTNGMWRDLQVRHDALATLAQAGEITAYSAWMVHGDGHPDMLCEISGKVISLGEESLLILAYDDITDKHEYELEILGLNTTLERRVDERTQSLTDALQQLTAAQAALGALVAGIAHELNTPIGNSLTVASTLQDNARAFAADMGKSLSRSKLDKFVNGSCLGADILVSSLHQAAELVSSFKQIAVDQSSMNRRLFRLSETVSEIMLTMGPTIRKTSHSVIPTISGDILMESYPGPLVQILSNLINNAFLHGFEECEQGKVIISANLQGADQLRLTVHDDGIGISETHLARVFDPFFTTKLGRGGSGLGLNIVYNLVQDVLGGTIQVSSLPGQGTCFTLILPLVAPVAPQEPTVSAEIPAEPQGSHAVEVGIYSI
ncbi:MAG: ATP-binding protein [Undibacterium sp.]|nr:ATP-binding protein [Undibacterium sp.]